MNRLIKQCGFGMVFFLIQMLLFNCKNPTQASEEEPEPQPKPPVGTVRLIIEDARNDDSTRTLIPVQPVFSSYRLSFSPLDNQQPKVDVPIPSDGTGVIRDIDLDAGNWKITAYGRVMFEGQEREVAEGIATTMVVVNENIEVTIKIQSKDIDGGNGKFAWSLLIPQHTEADSYTITLSEWNNEANSIINRTESIDTGITDVTIHDSVICESGYYILRVSIGTERQKAFYVDVVHIKTYKTTNLEYNVTSATFVPVVLLSGSVQVSLMYNGEPAQPPSIREVWAYSSAGERIGYGEITGNTWWMSLVKKEESRVVYFRVIVEILGTFLELKPDVSREVYHDDIASIDIDYTFNAITMSGTVNPLTNPAATKDNWEVMAYTNPANRDNSTLTAAPVKTDVNGNWSMVIGTFDAPTNVYFSITKTIAEKNYKRVDLHQLSISNTGISSIALTGYFIPPKKVWIKGILPATDNWGVSKEMLRSVLLSDAHSYQYTSTKTALTDAVYAINVLASFTGGGPDWDTLNDTNVLYNYANVIRDATGINYDGDADANIRWTNYQYKTIKVTLDFKNDSYLETGKPVLKVESRNEVLIPAGTFQMGSPDSEKGRKGPDGLNGQSSETRHTVRVTKSFYMMPFEISQELYEELMPRPANGYKSTGGYNFQKSDYPVVNISWLDAVAFANKLSERDGLPPVYTIIGAAVDADWASYGWRLPTEAEWEYTARAGSVTPFAPLAGDGTILNTDIANYNGSTTDPNFGYNPLPGIYRGHIVEVTSFLPNAWGLFNMHGNAWEFCWDWYAEYDTSRVDDPHGYDTSAGGWENSKGNGTGGMSPASQGNRIIRGGSYYCSARYLRSAHRGVISLTENTNNDIGFRLMRIKKEE